MVAISNPGASMSDLDEVHPYLSAQLQHRLSVLASSTRRQSLTQTLGELPGAELGKPNL